MKSFPIAVWGPAAALGACGCLIALAAAQTKAGTGTKISPQSLKLPANASAAITLPAAPIHIMRVVGLPQSQEVVNADVYTVPPGMRLVIEYVSYTCTAPAADSSGVNRLRVGTVVGGVQVWFDVFTLAAAPRWVGGSQPVRIYADARTPVKAIIERQFSPNSTARISLSGYLEPMDQFTPARLSR